jgi:hypothetical protein
VQSATQGQGGCVLESDEVSIFDGYNNTRLKLSLSAGKLLVVTNSNIDFGFNDTVLKVDRNEAIPADAVVDEKNVIFSAAIDPITRQFIRGRSTSVYLRFWPSYPPTGRYPASFSLIGFTRAYNEYQQCRN